MDFLNSNHFKYLMKLITFSHLTFVNFFGAKHLLTYSNSHTITEMSFTIVRNETMTLNEK